MTAKGHRLSPQARAKISESARRQWADPDFRNRATTGMKRAAADPAKRQAVSERWRALWADPDYRASRLKRTPEEWAEYNREWTRMDYQRNPEKYRARAKKWRDANPDKARAMSRNYQRQHREDANERVRKWMENPDNRAKTYARSRAYLKTHPELRRIHAARRRARLLNRFVEDVDPRIVLDRYNGLCGWCGDPVGPDFHVDHIIALVHGGEHSYANTQPVHPACNYEKRTVLKERAA